ncbi:MAG: hypothetical protein R3215_06490 [Halomonas sp.]|nr:hypothetical protein [Halomonas sp.]
MPYTEAKEHAPGRLHGIFVDPCSAFDNAATERLLNLSVATEALVLSPMRHGHLVLRVIHARKNGSFEPAAPCHSDHRPVSLFAFHTVADDFRQAFEHQRPLPRDNTSLLAEPLEQAIAAAEASSQIVDVKTRTIPARWPQAGPDPLHLLEGLPPPHLQRGRPLQLDSLPDAERAP